MDFILPIQFTQGSLVPEDVNGLNCLSLPKKVGNICIYQTVLLTMAGLYFISLYARRQTAISFVMPTNDPLFVFIAPIKSTQLQSRSAHSTTQFYGIRLIMFTRVGRPLNYYLLQISVYGDIFVLCGNQSVQVQCGSWSSTCSSPTYRYMYLQQRT